VGACAGRLGAPSTRILLVEGRLLKSSLYTEEIDQMINIFLLSHMEKLLVAYVERLLWSWRGSNPVPFYLCVQRFTSWAILPARI
jgi:hypothetical protein